MAEQPHLITNEDQPTPTGEWCTGAVRKKVRLVDAHWFEPDGRYRTRKWCADCYLTYQRKYRDDVRPNRANERYSGVYGESRVFRKRHNAIVATDRKWYKSISHYWRNLKRHYGVSKWDWLLLYYHQDGLCGICRNEEMNADSNTHVDHDHATGKVRGLLCRRCNIRMAAIDDADWKANAEAYKARTT